jgi:transcriptional regulator with XRE-family HTH domain
MSRAPRSLKVKPELIPEVRMKCKQLFPKRDSLAKKLGFSLATISNFLTGKLVDYSSFAGISECLGLRWQDLVSPYEEDETPPVPETVPNYAENTGQAQVGYAECQPIESGFQGEHQSPGTLMCISYVTDTEEQDLEFKADSDKESSEQSGELASKQAQVSSNATVATNGERSVSVGGNVSDSNIVTGDGNTFR